MSHKILTTLCLVFVLVSCSPARTAAPAQTSEVSQTSEVLTTSTPAPTETPIPTATQSATATPAIDVLRESLEICPGFEVLCTNPHAFGLAGAELTKWQDLRAQKNAEYTKAWGELINASSTWQAEYQTFFGEDAPTGAFESLSQEQQLNVIAAYMRVQNADGFMPFNISTDLINATIADPSKLFGYRDNVVLVGYENSPETVDMVSFDSMRDKKYIDLFKITSFGETLLLPWNIHMNDLGVYADDIVGPVFAPGEGFNAMYLFVYVRDKNGVKFPAFVEIPFVKHKLENGGYFQHADSPYSRVEAGSALNTTAPIKIAYWNGKSYENTSIGLNNIAQFWSILFLARDKGYHIVLSDESDYPSFFGGVKCVTTIVVFPSY